MPSSDEIEMSKRALRHPFQRGGREGCFITGIEEVVLIDPYRLDDVLRRRFGEGRYQVVVEDDLWWVEAPETLTAVSQSLSTCFPGLVFAILTSDVG